MNHCRERGEEIARIGDLAGDGGGGGGSRAREQRACSASLAPFKIAIAGAERIVTALHQIAIHADAHRAARLAPFGTRLDEDLCEATLLSLALDLLRAGNDQHAYAARH